MPQLDKTGPMGQGSQTGKKQGTCNSEKDANVEFAPQGRGRRRGLKFGASQESDNQMGLGRGAGRGRGNRPGRGMGQGRNL